MTVVVPRGLAIGCARAYVEGSSPDELPVATGAKLARAVPPERSGAHAAVVEARALGPDAGVDDADDDAVSIG